MMSGDMTPRVDHSGVRWLRPRGCANGARAARRPRASLQPMLARAAARFGTAATTPMNSSSPIMPNTASVSSMPVEPQRVCALPSTIVMYQIGVFDSDANTLYLVAAAPSPIASSTNAENPAYVSPVMNEYAHV